MRLRRRGFRRGVSTVVASIFFILMLALAIAFVEMILFTSSIIFSEHSRLVEERSLSAELPRSISGWWLVSNNVLEIHVTTRSSYTILLTGIAIVYVGGEYDVIGPNMNTIGNRFIGITIKKPDGTTITMTNPRLPLALGYGETIEVKLTPKTTSIASVSLSLSKPGTIAVASAPMLSYQEVFYTNVTPVLVQYSVELAPIALGNGTVATTGYVTLVGNYTPTNITIVNGTATGTLENMYRDDEIYYNISSVKTAYTGPWLTGWNYRLEIRVTENTGSTLNNYQLKIVINNETMNPSMLDHLFTNTQPKGEDIRFTLSDGVTTIPYWIQEWNPVNKTAVVWVKIPEIPGGETTIIYMYYGNPNATSESNLLNVIEPLPASDGANYVVYYEPWVMNTSLLYIPGQVFIRDYGDDNAYPYTLPFSFPYYSTTYTSIYVVSNGHIDFGSYTTDYISTIEKFQSLLPMVSPFWADLIDTDGRRTTYAIFYDPNYSDEYGSGVYFVWRSQFYRASGLQEVGVVLYSNGLIRFDYGTIYGTSSTDDTPVIGVSFGDNTHYTLLVSSDYEPASNWNNHPSILLWPRKKALVEPSYVFIREEGLISDRVDAEVTHDIPDNTTYGTIYMQVKANTSISVDYYLWNGSSWEYAGTLSIAQPNVEYVEQIVFTEKYVVNGVVSYKFNASTIEPFKLSIDYSLSEAYYPRSERLIYVGVGGTNTILVYHPLEDRFDENITAPLNTLFNGTTAITCDSRGYLWLATGSSLYYYDSGQGAWVYYASIPEVLGHGSSLIYHDGEIYVIVGGSSSSMYVYNIVAQETKPIRIDLGYPVGSYAVATLAGDSIYIAIGGGSTIFIKYNTSSNSIVRLEDSPTSSLVGLAYDYDRNLIWAIGRGGGLYYYAISSNTWVPTGVQPPYTPQGEGNRLIYYSSRLYHFRDDSTRELWVIKV